MLRSKLHYPKMPGSDKSPAGRCIAFEKYDGTNIHFDWDREFGWHSFGTRRDEFHFAPEGIAAFAKRHPQLSEAPAIFNRTMAQPLTDVFAENANDTALQDAQVFLEFFGPNSFAGSHQSGDEMELKLFDVWIGGVDAGFVCPEQFVADFGHLNAARAIYRGKLTGKFADDVRAGRFDVAEGVVCKGCLGGSQVWMVKIKTHAYMERLKLSFGKKWDHYWE